MSKDVPWDDRDSEELNAPLNGSEQFSGTESCTPLFGDRAGHGGPREPRRRRRARRARDRRQQRVGLTDDRVCLMSGTPVKSTRTFQAGRALDSWGAGGADAPAGRPAASSAPSVQRPHPLDCSAFVYRQGRCTRHPVVRAYILGHLSGVDCPVPSLTADHGLGRHDASSLGGRL